MRVYLPASPALIREWVRQRAAGPPPLTGYAVTPGLLAAARELEGRDTDSEALEYEATALAARASLRILGGEARRAVVVVEVAQETARVRDDLQVGAVQLSGMVPLARFCCALVDDEEAEVAVRQAIAAVAAADRGDEVAQATIAESADHKLAWFAVQELADL